MKQLFDYFADGIIIDKTEDGYDVFTPATKKFRILSFDELLPERFEVAIAVNRLNEMHESESFKNFISSFVKDGQPHLDPPI